MAQTEETKGKSPPPGQRLQESSLLKPKITYRESAKYTKEARENIAHGIVALSVVFRVGGNISDIKVVSGLPDGLIESAIEAAKKIRFEPGMKDGQPVSVRGTLEFAFDLYDLNEGSIRKMLRNDFPVLSEDVVKVMASEIHKRGDNDSRNAWQYGQQRLENGVSRLPQSEQEELMGLTLIVVIIIVIFITITIVASFFFMFIVFILGLHYGGDPLPPARSHSDHGGFDHRHRMAGEHFDKLAYVRRRVVILEQSRAPLPV